MNETHSAQTTGVDVSRREFVQSCAAAVIALPILGCQSVTPRHSRGPASHTMALDQDWRFGGELKPGALAPNFDDAAFEKVTLPHCATKLSWQNWSWEEWQKVWCYRRHF